MIHTGAISFLIETLIGLPLIVMLVAFGVLSLVHREKEGRKLRLLEEIFGLSGIILLILGFLGVPSGSILIVIEGLLGAAFIVGGAYAGLRIRYNGVSRKPASVG